MKNKLSKTKKGLSILLALVVVISSFAIGMTSYAYTRTLFLDKVESAQTDGSEDMLMFKYVPEKSGMYTFLQTNSRSLEAYLFIKEQNPDGSKQYRQLAFSNKSPNYKKYGQPKENVFCLSYHLEAGKTYYFGVVAPYPTVDKVSVSVKLICEGYDDNLISFIEAECPASLKWYTDGEWKTDANGKQYFYYNISKIIANTKITVHYTDGTVKSATGVQNFDGLNVMYNHNQHEKHWYVPNDVNYTSNDFVVKILDKSATINVSIEEGALYPVKGKVVDYLTNEPIKNASVLVNGQNVAKTEENGLFAFNSAEGKYQVSIKAENSIINNFYITIAKDVISNDHTSVPYKLVMCDFVNDEVINTKDSSFVYNSDMAPDVKQRELDRIDQLLGANKDIYK